nr:hypothetical protein [Tanacetum cinerariifolium]
MFDCDDYCTSESDESLHPSPIYDRYQSEDGYHAVPPPYTGTFMPPKPDLVFHNAPNDVETDDSKSKIPQDDPSFVQPTEQVKPPRSSVQHVETSIPVANPKTAIPKPKSQRNSKNRNACFQYARMSLPNPQRHVVPTAVLTQSKLVTITAARPITTVVPNTNVTRPRQAKTLVTKPNSPPRRHINRSPSSNTSNFLLKVTAVKALMVNVVQGVQGKWEWKRKCPILDHVSRNTSASMTLKRFDYNDAPGRSKSVKGKQEKDKIGSKPDKKGSVKGKQEKDKIESKPNKKGSVTKPEKVKANHSKERKKTEENISSRDQKIQILEVVYIKDKDKG